VSEMEFETFAKIALEALQSGNVTLLAALALMGLVALARGVFGERLPFLKSDLGAALFTLFLGFLGAIVTALAGGEDLSLNLALTALKVTVSAMGGYSLLKKLLLPAAEKVLPKPKGVEGLLGKPEEVR
jgi:hypothetical protein